MMTITRGSLFLSDDFVQAMTYNTPAQFNGYALVKLPAWNNAGMSIDAAELGLSAGVADPNVILPAVFTQYWQNLCAHARQYHSHLDYGEDIEDFSEQAFWKMMQRLMPYWSQEDIATCVVAKSNDIIVNTNSVDGNLYMEVMLSVNANIAKQTAALEPYKPTYLQTVAQLPSTGQATILGGHSKALYDADKTYYDILENKCWRAVMSQQETRELDFEYNAIVLYYSLGDVDQIAGIYFPNQFIQNSAGDYELPAIQKRSDITLGYSINIRYRAGEAYSFSAANADAGLAMQVYNNWYSIMSKANLQLADITLAVAKQGQQLDQLRSMFDSGFLTSLYNQIASLKQQVATTFQGSVSTNKLLDMFIQAKQNTGQLDLTVMLSDLAQSITARDIKVGQRIGSYAVGDTIPIGSSITDILANIVSTGSGFIYTQPSGYIKGNGELATLFIPYHDSSAIALEVAMLDGDSGGFIYPAVLTVAEPNGSSYDYAINEAVENFTFTPNVQPTNLIMVQAMIQYNEGDVKEGDESGIDKVLAGILHLQLRIIPVYTAYIGGIALLEQLENVTGNDVRNWRSVQSNVLDSVYSLTDHDYQCFAVPSDCQCPLTNVVSGTTKVTIDGIEYTVYAAKTRYLTIDTSNLQ